MRLLRIGETSPSSSAPPAIRARSQRRLPLNSIHRIICGSYRDGRRLRMAIQAGVRMPWHWVPWLGQAVPQSPNPAVRRFDRSHAGRSVPCPDECPLCRVGWDLRLSRFFSFAYVSEQNHVLKSRDFWQITELQYSIHFDEPEIAAGLLVEAWFEQEQLIIQPSQTVLRKLPPALDIEGQIRLASMGALIEIGWISAEEAIGCLHTDPNSGRMHVTKLLEGIGNTEVLQDLTSSLDDPRSPALQEKCRQNYRRFQQHLRELRSNDSGSTANGHLNGHNGHLNGHSHPEGGA